MDLLILSVGNCLSLSIQLGGKFLMAAVAAGPEFNYYILLH